MAGKLCLIILDGWGHGPDPKVSAIAQAKTPFVDDLYRNYPNAELVTHGSDVGLPEGQMGNSEVGHLNIGAGRVVYQELARINKAFDDKSFAENPVFQKAIQYAKEKNVTFHLLGLVSDGGVHSHINHLKSICDVLSAQAVSKVCIHAFTDGRDTDPKSGLRFIKELEDHIRPLNYEIATITGRYYAMDRDRRWERIKLAYDALVHGRGEPSEDVLKTMKARYEAGETDEFLHPIINSKSAGNQISDGDVVLFFNFRTDRPRQLTEVLSQSDHSDHGMKKLHLHYLTMTPYDDQFKNVGILFEKENLENTLGEYLAELGLKQTRIAETEKYPHVTYFFSGGREIPFEGENRILIQSPKVATYDLKPEMSAYSVTLAILREISENRPHFICLNYANTDMVGHTGDFEAAIKASETVDECLSTLIPIGLEHGYSFIVIADHGNSDCLINPDGSPHTAHTTNPVPIFYIPTESDPFSSLIDGKLGDIAPTILHLMGLEIPKEMTGNILVHKGQTS